ncbi:endonuclease [Ferrimonas pelagia]|uniref:LTD domain-containing protein n=1 Tax=Ferrimonas pelagia TaxID=1177826 RepID=A0ABP9ECT2_9GAMM
MAIKFRPVGIALAVLMGSLSATVQADLVITEYIEGGGYNKALEISNLGNDTVDLDADIYTLNLYTNGSPTVSKSLTMTGLIAPGQSFVYFHGDAATEFHVGTQANDVMNFNGDDALTLMLNDTVIDRVGIVGDRPSSGGWTDPNDPDFNTKDKTLRRRNDITTGDTDSYADFPGADNQWVTFDKDTADGLGCPGEAACGESPGVLLITEYVEGTNSNKAIELSNVGSAALDLDAHEYKLTLYTNGKGWDEPGSNEVLTGILQPGESIVFHNASAWDEFKVGTASTVTYFNGDDALVLTKDDVVIDRFGKLGHRPDDGWTDPNDPNFHTMDKTLRRKASITTGDTDAEADFPSSPNQWLVFEVNTADGLGCPGENACEDDTPPPPCNGCDEVDKVADASIFNPDEYYTAILSGSFDSSEAMRSAISAVIASDQKKLTYKEVWTVVSYSDEDPTNPDNVIKLYSGESVSKQSNGSAIGSWNREHVWPKSKGFPSESQWGYTDAHHLRPADMQVNSTRSNYDFEFASETGSEVSNAPGNYVDHTLKIFEPRDAVKGDVARMMLYMDTRYQGAEGDGNMPNLTLLDEVFDVSNAGDDIHFAGVLCTLYQWHMDDPVDDTDRYRNDVVYEYQGNRNPYIDYPEWVQQVYGAQCGDAPLPDLDVDVIIDAPSEVAEGEAFILDASATTGAEDQVLSFSWAQVSGPETDFTTDGAVLTGVAPMVNSDTSVQFMLTVSDGELQTQQTVTLTVTGVAFEVSIDFSGPGEVQQGELAVISATLQNVPEGQSLSYRWEQRYGTTAEFSAEGLTLNVTAPQVAMDQQLQFALIVSNGHDEVEASYALAVLNQQAPGWTMPDGAGSIGGLTLLLLPLIWRRRRHA